ncbi:MAG TPA: IS200/IS605 family transposase [Ignavibacteria bacterium]|nr:IS200/IS605 family transposase [Ignavibacteria bacterium]HMR00456.1 IS200/IS605 family transposase [Ignavibacteria bacterium]
MPNTFTQLYIHIVFAVKSRNALINRSWEDKLYKYITGTVQKMGQKMLRINGMPDHIHFLIGLKPDIAISVLVREVKKSSSSYIKEEGLTKYSFNWQSGFGAFSVSLSQLDKVINYIINQKEHHRKRTFKEEYIELLRKYEVEYDEKYLFEWIED